MRRLYFIFAMLLAAWAAQGAQVTRTYTLNFSQSDFTFTESEGVLYIYPSNKPYSFDTDTAKPALPFVDIYISI